MNRMIMLLAAITIFFGLPNRRLNNFLSLPCVTPSFRPIKTSRSQSYHDAKSAYKLCFRTRVVVAYVIPGNVTVGFVVVGPS